MDEHLSADDRLRQMIDAVRPMSDDLSQADFRDLALRLKHDPQLLNTYQRSQQLDRTIGESLTELPIPAGSVDRLLATLAKADPAKAATSAKAAAAKVAPAMAQEQQSVAAKQKLDAAPSRSRKERVWGAPLALAIVSVLVLLGYLSFRPETTTWGPDEILGSEAMAQAEETLGEPHQLDVTAAPARYPAGDALAVKPVAWREITGLLGRAKGVAYDLRAAAASAILYVIDDDARPNAPQFVNLPTSPATSPLKTTQRRAMSMWRRGKLVYLLVVKGGEAEYRAFVNPAGQLAFRASNLPDRIGNLCLLTPALLSRQSG